MAFAPWRNFYKINELLIHKKWNLIQKKYKQTAGATCPVVVVGNQSRYKSRPRNTPEGIFCGRLRLALILLVRNFLRSYSVRANANAILSMSQRP